MKGLSSSYSNTIPTSVRGSPRPGGANSSFPNGVSTNLRDVLGVRRGGVGGDRTTGKRSESLTPERSSLAGCRTEEHCAGGEAQLKMG